MSLDWESDVNALEREDEGERSKVFTGWSRTGLGMFQVQVVDASSTRLFSPNTLQAEVAAERLKLGTPVGPSDISHQPAYLYRTHELQLLLTKGELARLVLHRLHATEVHKLRRRFGTFFDIDDDFYDRVTGAPLTGGFHACGDLS